MHFVEQKINFIKNETESKMENSTHCSLERRTLCLSSFKNRKLKVNLSRVGAHKRKKGTFYEPFILSEGHFLTFVFYLNV